PQFFARGETGALRSAPARLGGGERGSAGEAGWCTANVAGAWDLFRRALRSGLLEPDDMGDGGGEAAPVGGLFFQMPSPEPGEGEEIRAGIVFSGLPFGGDPAFLLELV